MFFRTRRQSERHIRQAVVGTAAHKPAVFLLSIDRRLLFPRIMTCGWSFKPLSFRCCLRLRVARDWVP